VSKFNTPQAATQRFASGPITASSTADAKTHEGGRAYTRDTKSDLFMLAVVNMVGEQTFYESADSRDTRFRDLVRAVAIEDAEWMVTFIHWLRNDANMRSASLVAAAETAYARKEAGLAGWSRQAVSAALQRADEPGEFLAYWLGRYAPDGALRRKGAATLALPKPVRRGLADAAVRLYSEYSLTKYDTGAVRFGDVIDLVKPTNPTYSYGHLRGTAQGDLFKYAMDRRRNPDVAIPESLTTLAARAELLGMSVSERRRFVRTPDASGRLQRAGMTWEALAGWLQGPMDAEAWQAIMPSMGYMALLRNLRNFDQAGVPDEVADQVAARLANPSEVARSRQLPYRFLSAYMATDSDRWRTALGKALDASVANIPALPGRTLVLVDTSASMTTVPISARSKVNAMMGGALFGVAIAAKGQQADLFGFADGTRPFPHKMGKGASVLRQAEQFVSRSGEDGHGTRIWGSVKKTFDGHDRVIIFTDGQTFASPWHDAESVESAVPADVPVYAFNLGGYGPGPVPAGQRNRHELGGLSDQTFTQIGLLETGVSAGWPWDAVR
jgi:hypothetical protein